MDELAITVRVRWATARMLEELVEKGYYSTKAEALRAGILHLAEEYGMIGSPVYYRRMLKSEIGRQIKHEEIERVLEEIEERH
jgi:Arc/MetJ-type ribon-helix-helix transcriptional regulator